MKTYWYATTMSFLKRKKKALTTTTNIADQTLFIPNNTSLIKQDSLIFPLISDQLCLVLHSAVRILINNTLTTLKGVRCMGNMPFCIRAPFFQWPVLKESCDYSQVSNIFGTFRHTTRHKNTVRDLNSVAHTAQHECSQPLQKFHLSVS